MRWLKNITSAVRKQNSIVIPLLALGLLHFSFTNAAVATMLLSVVGQLNWQRTERALLQLCGLLGLIAAIWLFHPGGLPQLFPFMLSTSFALLFWSSLKTDETLLESYVHKFKGLNDEERRFLRTMTKFWTGLCAVNSLMLLWFLVFPPQAGHAGEAVRLSYILIMAMIVLTIFVGVVRRVQSHQGSLKIKFVFIVRFVIGFSVFGTMCLAFIAVLPLVRLYYISRRDEFEFRCQQIIRPSFRFVLWYLRLIRIIDVQVNLAQLRGVKPEIIICNHISMFDIVAVLATFPNCYTFVKQKYLKIFVIAPIIRACGFIPVDTDSATDKIEAYRRAAEVLKAGKTLVAWPEGTRSKTGAVGEFHRGIFKLALDLSKDLTPVIITSNPPVFNNTDTLTPFTRLVDFRLKVMPKIAVPKVDVADRASVLRLRDDVRSQFVTWVKDADPKAIKPTKSNANIASAQWLDINLPDTWVDQLSISHVRYYSMLLRKLLLGKFDRVKLPPELPGQQILPAYLLEEFHRVPNGYYSKRYSEAYNRGFEWSMLGKMTPLRQEMARLIRGQRVLDMGCGTGHLAMELKKSGCEEVWGVDPCPYLLQFAQSKNPGVNFAQAIAESTKFSDNYFDAAGVCFVFHELPNNALRAALTELHRIVRPGGRLVICEPSPEQLFIRNPIKLIRLGGLLALYFRALAKFVYEPYVIIWHKYAGKGFFAEHGFNLIEDKTHVPFRTFVLERL